MTEAVFDNLLALAAELRSQLANKKYLLIYAYNGTGKTRLSMAFKDIGKEGDDRDTLYFNAFTEDLFTWDNDLDGDNERVLKMNRDSSFLVGLVDLEMENRVRPLLQRYADFDFAIDYENRTVRFSREVATEDGTETIDNIKVSRGEENTFIWCFFLAVVQVAMDADLEAYNWVKYVYIDDPISSLDEHNAIAVANHLAQLLKQPDNQLKTVISSHHTLFFNVMCNELGRAVKLFLSKRKNPPSYVLRPTGETPFFHHVAMLSDLYQAAERDELYTYHFNMLRTILEKSASFHGFNKFSACIKQQDDDPEGILHARIINILSHGNYSLYEPQVMLDENKEYFKTILTQFLERYPFNPELFPEVAEEAEAS
ncbi:AAA family ATPase [uncultured Tateyamaria sp.]|uniref:AAA family ATPase n=1 Tax=uncultured Tateyamaria sp. TaxID=455651 RepID=UPI00262F90BB|nr:AAA family ATPase [uncultured Tateyamaria sp.]